MWGKKQIPEPEEQIPDDVIEEVFERIKPQIEQMIVQHVQGAVGASLEEFRKKELFPLIKSIHDTLKSLGSELNMLKQSAGLSFDKIMRELLSAQNYAVASEAAREVVDKIGVTKIELFETYITEIEKEIDVLQEGIESLEKALKGMKASADDILTEIKKERAELSKMCEELREFLDTAKKRISAEFEAAVSEVKKKISIDNMDIGKIIRESVSTIVADELTKIEERLIEATQDIHSTAESVSGLAVAAENMKSLERAVEDLAEEVKALSAKVEALESKVQSSSTLDETAEMVKNQQNAVYKKLPPTAELDEEILSE